MSFKIFNAILARRAIEEIFYSSQCFDKVLIINKLFRSGFSKNIDTVKIINLPQITRHRGGVGLS